MRNRALNFLDVLIVLSVVAGVVLELAGGFYARPFGIRVSARSPDRPLIAAFVLAFVRWRLLRNDRFLNRSHAWYRGWRDRLFHVDADRPDLGARRVGHWWAVFGLIAAAGLMLQAQIRHMNGVPDLGDPLFSIWRIGWVFTQLQGDPRALFDGNIFHPMPLGLTRSDSMLLPSLATSGLLAAGLHPLTAYNLALMAAFPITGLATYYLVWKLTGSRLAGFAGGFMYMSHPYRFEHYSHFELQMTMWMPLAMALAVRFLETTRTWMAVAAAVCAVAQLYSSMYYGVFLPVYAATILAVVVITRRLPVRPLVRPALMATVVALVLAIPLARPYLAAQKIKGDRSTSAVEFYSADLSDYLRPHHRVATHRGWWLPDTRPERALFPGVMPVALSIVAMAPPVGATRVAFAAGMVIAYDMSHGMKGVLYPYLYNWFPPLRGMRVPARFSIILGLSLAVLGAFGFRRLVTRFPAGVRRNAAAAALLGLLFIDLRPNLVLEPLWTEPPPVYEALDSRSDVVLAEFPFESEETGIPEELPFMYFSSWHWRQMVNGYSGFVPDEHKALVKLAAGFPDEASIVALRRRGVTHVTVNCRLVGEGCDKLVAAIARRSELRLERTAQWQGAGVYLYQLLMDDPRRPKQ